MVDEPEPWAAGYLRDGRQFAWRCAQHRDTNPFKQPALDAIMAYLATELWDHGFSQTEIKSAFGLAVELLATYAARDDRRE